MNSPPRRARFQIHLSTAIVLMFVAGGLIWANVYGRRTELFGTGPSIYNFEYLGRYWFVEHGWPLNAMQTSSEEWTDRDGKTQAQNMPLPSEWRAGPIICNALVALAILFAIWFLCEWLIRRRAARMGG